MNRLRRPSIRQFAPLSISRQVEVEGWIDDANAKQFRPDRVDCSTGKLRMSGDHTRQSYAWIFSCSGLLASQDECWTHVSLIARQPYNTWACTVIAFAVITEHKLIHQVAIRPVHPHLAKKT